jgi:hypothetical protein
MLRLEDALEAQHRLPVATLEVRAGQRPRPAIDDRAREQVERDRDLRRRVGDLVDRVGQAHAPPHAAAAAALLDDPLGGDSVTTIAISHGPCRSFQRSRAEAPTPRGSSLRTVQSTTRWSRNSSQRAMSASSFVDHGARAHDPDRCRRRLHARTFEPPARAALVYSCWICSSDVLPGRPLGSPAVMPTR